MAKKKRFSCGTNAGNPEPARWAYILLAWVANQNVGYTTSYPLADSAI